MRNFGIAPIILLILFVVVPIINYFLARKERERKQRAQSRRQAAERAAEPRARRPAEPRFEPPPEPPRPRTQAPPPSVRPPAPRWSRQALFRSKRDLRRMIVVMTILGPCRANDPPD